LHVTGPADRSIASGKRADRLASGVRSTLATSVVIALLGRWKTNNLGSLLGSPRQSAGKRRYIGFRFRVPLGKTNFADLRPPSATLIVIYYLLHARAHTALRPAAPCAICLSICSEGRSTIRPRERTFTRGKRERREKKQRIPEASNSIEFESRETHHGPNWSERRESDKHCSVFVNFSMRTTS